MNNFAVRTLSGAVMAVIVIAAILASPLTLLLLCSVITAGGMYEFFRLARNRDDINFLYPIIAGLCILSLSFLAAWTIIPAQWLLLALPVVFALFIIELYRHKGDPLSNVAVSVAGIIYIAVPMSLLACLGIVDGISFKAYNYLYVLFYIVLIWINDVGAYIIGITMGKHRLFERISPKKSWEGFFGGVIFTLAASLAIAYFYDHNYLMWLTIGIVLPLSAVAGDLVESMFKRAAGVKDSGSIMPGHGGFLDRFDAVFVSIPFVYVIVKFLG